MRSNATSSVAAFLALLSMVATAHGGTLYVANNGVDGAACGPKSAPCRSISKAIDNAAPGDKIIVGPGRYGDLDTDGTTGETGEETGFPFCGCVLGIDKAVSITSSHGAGATIIEARSADATRNVIIASDDVVLGKPGKGFTITRTLSESGQGITVTNANRVTVSGNDVVAPPSGQFLPFPTTPAFGGRGIVTSAFASEDVLIEANRVSGWNVGIEAIENPIIRKNQVRLNGIGIIATGQSAVIGNLVMGNGNGIRLGEQANATGNTTTGNTFGMDSGGGFTGQVTGNNLYGNSECGFYNTSSTVTVNAPNNYWGAATGPGPDPADTACGPVSTSPPATRAFKTRKLKL